MTTFDLIPAYAVALAAQRIPYIWGGKNIFTGVDCSGLAEHLLNICGVDTPGVQNAQMLFDDFVQRPGPSGMSPGALIFCGKSIRAITHVQVALNSRQVIESGGGGSECTSPEIAIPKGAGVRLMPFSHRKDVVAIVGVAYPALPEVK